MVHRPSDEGVRARIQHIPALKDIERSLGCFDYPKRNRTVDLSTDEHPCYISLGAVDNFTDTFLEWAYDRQCECDPSNKPYYLDCLADLASGRGSADLQTKVVMATSSGELGQKVIEDSYQYFNLDPDSVEGDDHIIGLYKSRIESAPRQKEEARECLRVIAKHRSSDKIEALANDKTMSVDEALEFLGVSSDTAADSIEASAVALVRPFPILAHIYAPFRLQETSVDLALRSLSNHQIRAKSHELYALLQLTVQMTLLYNAQLLLWNRVLVVLRSTSVTHTTDFRSQHETLLMRPFLPTIKV